MSGTREIVKYIVAVVLYYSGLLWLYGVVGRVMFNRPNHVILMYHRVLDDLNAEGVFTQPGMSVSTMTFQKQARYLKEKFEILNVVQLARLIEDGVRIKRPVAVITFDDGWRDNYTNAFPVLKEYDMPATIFLTTDYIGTTRPFWFLMIKWLLTEGSLSPGRMAEIVTDMAGTISAESEVLAELVRIIKTTELDTDRIIETCKKLELDTLDQLIAAMLSKSKLSMEYWEQAKPMLTWAEVMEMNRSKVEVGSHGCSHRILTLLPPQEITKELSGSKSAIETKLGIGVASFSYPNGNFDDEIKQGTQQAGYRCAVATAGKKDDVANIDRFALRRVTVHEGISTGISGRFSKAMFAWHIVRHS